MVRPPRSLDEPKLVSTYPLHNCYTSKIRSSTPKYDFFTLRKRWFYKIYSKLKSLYQKKVYRTHNKFESVSVSEIQWKITKISVNILWLHDLPSLSPKVRFLARSGPPFVIRGIPIQYENAPDYKWRTWTSEIIEFGGEREEIVQTQNSITEWVLNWLKFGEISLNLRLTPVKIHWISVNIAPLKTLNFSILTEIQLIFTKSQRNSPLKKIQWSTEIRWIFDESQRLAGSNLEYGVGSGFWVENLLKAA